MKTKIFFEEFVEFFFAFSMVFGKKKDEEAKTDVKNKKNKNSC